MADRRGFILLMTFIFMIVLTVFVGAMLYTITYAARSEGAARDDYGLLNLSDAGVERALRELRAEDAAPPVSGVADLRGATASGTATSVTNIRYVDGTSATVATSTAILRAFDSNYSSSPIISVSIGARAAKASGGSAVLRVTYAIGGVTGASVMSVNLPAATALADYYQAITADRAWTWDDILGAAGNFTLTATRSSGNRNITLDAIYLRVTYRVDALTEPWATGSYQSYPVTLGGGAIRSVTITDEQGKVHLNTASQTLLSNLMIECGIASGTAGTLATNIVSYRTTKPFDTVEELQLVSSMTQAYYNLIKDYVTVYSYINPYVTRLTGSRAGININTASLQALKAVFDPLGLGAGDPASLAADIITARSAAPFTCFYSANSAVTTDFYDFVNARAYLTAAERNIVLDNADASLLIPVSGYAGSNCATTEFTYSSAAFRVESLSSVASRNFRVKTVLAPGGSRLFTTYSGDTTSVGYRMENFE